MVKGGFFLFCYIPPWSTAETIDEHVSSFKKYSNLPITIINFADGFPKNISLIKPEGFIFHYSAFASMKKDFYDYVLDNKNAVKIAFFQDEMHNWDKRTSLINNLEIDIVYTCFEENEHYIYKKFSSIKEVHTNITGYVDQNLITKARKYFKEDNSRTIDIGYRGRQIDYFFGSGAQEKHSIAVDFENHVIKKNLNLNVDLKSKEHDRLYGSQWYEFLADSKGTLGVESGTSIVDLDGSIEKQTNQFISENPEAGFNEVHKKILERYENNIYYRSISPRIFESAAFKICMILFEGKYSGILQPGVHYIELKKDFSNINQVLSDFSRAEVRKKITENAYKDLIASDRYSYENFISNFDKNLISYLGEEKFNCDIDLVNRLIDEDLMFRKILKFLKGLVNFLVLEDNPNSTFILKLIRKILNPYKKILLNKADEYK